jgi:predicted glycosyltransferase
LAIFRSTIKKGCKPGTSRVLTHTREKNVIEALQTKKNEVKCCSTNKGCVFPGKPKQRMQREEMLNKVLMKTSVTVFMIWQMMRVTLASVT